MQDSGEASAWPIASVVRALLLLPLVLIAVVDSRYRFHDCHGSCRDDPSPVELLVRIWPILQSQVSNDARGVVVRLLPSGVKFEACGKRLSTCVMVMFAFEAMLIFLVIKQSDYCSRLKQFDWCCFARPWTVDSRDAYIPT